MLLESFIPALLQIQLPVPGQLQLPVPVPLQVQLPIPVPLQVQLLVESHSKSNSQSNPTAICTLTSELVEPAAVEASP